MGPKQAGNGSGNKSEYKDKEKPTQIRLSNIIAAKGIFRSLLSYQLSYQLSVCIQAALCCTNFTICHYCSININRVYYIRMPCVTSRQVSTFDSQFNFCRCHIRTIISKHSIDIKLTHVRLQCVSNTFMRVTIELPNNDNAGSSPCVRDIAYNIFIYVLSLYSCC